MKRYSFLDVPTMRYGGIEMLFPDWKGNQERLLVYSPHDDDAIIGAGYAMRAALDDGAEVHVIIVCSGNCGYSTPDQKNTIVETRRRETLNCYKAFGIPEENIIFFGYSDFSALNYIGWNISPEHEGHFRRSITEIRKRRITRMLVPNHYHEHVDHIAAYMMGAYDAPQAGDAHTVDWATPFPVASVAQYSVWAELDPEDALIHRRDPDLRADMVLIADEAVERCVDLGLKQFVSQTEIIADLMRQRKERQLKDGRYIELYLHIDPRPKLNFAPYKRLIEQ